MTVSQFLFQISSMSHCLGLHKSYPRPCEAVKKAQQQQKQSVHMVFCCICRELAQFSGVFVFALSRKTQKQKKHLDARNWRNSCKKAYVTTVD